MQIKKAIIPVAGWGTRRLPITKTIEKAMLPIGNRPLVDYVVEDCAKAGITDAYIVIDEKPFSQITDYYQKNPQLEQYLQSRGKNDRLQLADTARAGLKLHFFCQKDLATRYGNALPVAQVVEAFAIDEPVAVLMGDDFIYNADGSSELLRLTKAVKNADDSAMLAAQVPLETVERYGVLEVKDGLLTNICEKPKRADAPSNLINVSKFIMSPALLRRVVAYCHEHDFGPQDQEYLITDPVFEYIKAGGKLHVLPIKGQYLDGGSLEGWLHANRVIFGD